MAKLAVLNGTVALGDGTLIDNGTVVIEDGTIVAVGSDTAVPPGAEIVDAQGGWITPGLIDAHTHISVKGEPAWAPSVADITEITSPITPTMRAIDALNPADRAIPAVRGAGFTTVCALPGSGNLVGGQSVVFKTHAGSTIYDLVVDAPTQIKFALGENPKRIHGIEQKKAPKTRMGNAAMVREVLGRAVEYSETLRAAESSGERVKREYELEPLVPVVRGERGCRIHSHRADDIVTAVRIAQEFSLKFVVDHGTESWKITDFLRENDVTCIVGPLDMAWDKQEVWGVRLDTPALLEQAGVTFCLTQDSRSGTRFLPAFVGIAIAHGLSEQTAMRAVTINPARVLGIEDQVGSLKVGKSGDVAVFSGHPFNSMSACLATVIDGRVYR